MEDQLTPTLGEKNPVRGSMALPGLAVADSEPAGDVCEDALQAAAGVN